MVSYDQIVDLFEFFIKEVFIFIWHIIRPNMNNDVVWLFLDLELNDTLDALSFSPGKNQTFIFLLEFRLKPTITESPVINVVPFLHFSGCLGGSISDECDNDALFFASSVSTYANTGWEKQFPSFLQLQYRALLFQCCFPPVFFT